MITVAGNRGLLLEDQAWVKEAFGSEAEITQRTYAVLVKGIPTNKLRGADPKALCLAIKQENNGASILRCHPRIPRAPAAPRGALLLEVGSVEEAARLCDLGVIYQAEIFNAEPYSPEVEPRRCFRCHQFGHFARFCREMERCGRCASGAHEGGESSCSAAPRCVSCKGRHAAWDRKCPAYTREKAKAEQAYRHRPLTFAQAQVYGQSTASRTPMAPPSRKRAASPTPQPSAILRRPRGPSQSSLAGTLDSFTQRTPRGASQARQARSEAGNTPIEDQEPPPPSQSLW